MHLYVFNSDCSVNISKTVAFLLIGSCSSYINIPYGGYYLYSSPYSFQSPNYPSCYPNNKDCTWLIETTWYNYIHLTIHQFNLEYDGNHCRYDYLEIRDGNTSSSPLITKTCGSVGYIDIYSSGRFLLVRFVSDSSIQMPGFAANCYGFTYSKKTFFALLSEC